ncbi:amino acid ABC transporter permease (plasmid) [Agrobacterium leguminum]|uniref:amino acid ABC transporter permease n=1 Tax=Agrobacterium leguminum TaxID=2792015 RepID=UPI00272ADB99|nr:amino acid ABC transporter permease [Agrobacterium leguminum]WLE00813.1 amino acid ABC transporter permease [Agrobacterium leguminum]
MTYLSPAPRSMGLAVASVATATLLLLVIGVLGGTVRGQITSPELSNFALGTIVVGLIAVAFAAFTSFTAMSLAMRARTQTAAGEILEARASADVSRQSSLTTLGSAGAVIIAFALVQLTLLNDGSIQRTFLQWDLIKKSAVDVAGAFLVNIKLAVIAQVIVLLFGLILAVARMAPGKAGAPIRFMAVAYIDLMRAVPAVIVLYLIGFGLPLTNLPFISSLSADWFAILALSLTYSAYVAEIYRSGIDSIHPSQWSASRSLGFSYAQTLQFFILPQAIRLVIPPLLSAFIALQKDTSLVNVIGTLDAFNQAKFYASASFNLSSVTVVAILFVLITIPQTRYVDWMLNRAVKRRRA